jgi:hypothetical protein
MLVEEDDDNDVLECTRTITGLHARHEKKWRMRLLT